MIINTQNSGKGLQCQVQWLPPTSVGVQSEGFWGGRAVPGATSVKDCQPCGTENEMRI